MSRKAPNLETKLAAALLMTGMIPYEHAKAMGRTNFLSLWHFDHGALHADGGSDEFWNLTPRLIVPHRIKTATIDAPALAKGRDIRATEAIHKAQIASRAGDYHTAAVILAAVEKPSRLKQKRKIPSRPLRSRNTFERRA